MFNLQMDDRFRIYSALAFIFVVVVIGVPMWWKTTEVYRASLPRSDISNLPSPENKIKVSIGIYSIDSVRSQLLSNELQNHLKKENDGVWNIDVIQIKDVENADNAKTPAALESMISKKFIMKAGDFLFLEWAKLKEDIFLTSDRSALISKDATSTKLYEILRTSILQSHRINSNLLEQSSVVNSAPPKPEYDVLISVLNPRPDLMELDWNVQLATEMYIEPFLKNLKEVSNFNLKTQWRHQVPFDFPSEKISDNSSYGHHYKISEESLPHLVTLIEKKIGNGVSESPSIHIVVYVPPCYNTPLRIYQKRDNTSPKNNIESFVSTNWGGIIIYNPSSEFCLQKNYKEPKPVLNINSKATMQTILYILRKLIDLHVDIFTNGVTIDNTEHILVRQWEYDSYMRRSTVSRIATATQTLQSLIQLLDGIDYIGINDDVGMSINDAYKNILAAIENLKRNDLLNACDHAKSAFILSEMAFFEASLLVQLYFPDEQKYAIYIPLFLPVMVPVVSSLTIIKNLVKFSK